MQIRCLRCGSFDVNELGDTCVCAHCGASYRQDSAEKFAVAVQSIFGEELAAQKQEQIANARRNLWTAVTAENISTAAVLAAAREVKKLLPEDFAACFYEVAVSGTVKQINAFLNSIDAQENALFIEDVVLFMLRGMESANVLPLKDLINRSFKGEKFVKYMTAAEEEAAKLKEGLYSPQIPRDVFVAYSSKDGKAVNELVEFLEENKLSCFVALRNLRHGKGSVENYINNLKTAMHNCKCVVFVSTENSRDLDCDALKIELPYIKDNEPRMGRIEYLAGDYGDSTTFAAKLILEDFFGGLEYCRTREDLVRRILKYSTGIKQIKSEPEVKYCLNCGEKNPVKAKRCMECGSDLFAASYEQYLDKKNARMQEEARKKLEEEYAEKFRKQREELERQRAELEKQRAESENRRTQPEKSAQPEKSDEPKITANGVTPAAVKSDGDFEIAGDVLQKYKGNAATVTIPEGITKIAGNVTDYDRNGFINNKNLVSVNLPESLKEIGDGAFDSCEKLTSALIPKNVEKIGQRVFAYCENLCSLAVAQGNRYYYSDGNCIIERATGAVIAGCKNSVIPADGSIKSIGAGAFEGCADLNKITIPRGVFKIEKYAFWGCCGVNELIIPDGVTEIGSYALGVAAESITIPASVVKMDRNVFYDSENLTIYCVASKQPAGWAEGWSGGYPVVWGCKKEGGSFTESDGGTARPQSGKAKEPIIFPNLQNYNRDLYVIQNTVLKKYLGNEKEVRVPYGVTEVEAEAFKWCRSQDIALPGTVRTIGRAAFAECPELRNVTLPDGIGLINERLFEKCPKLISAGIPASVTKICDYAYAGCASLRDVTLPYGLEFVGRSAFENCTKLNKISIPQTVKEIGVSAFAGCSYKSFELPYGFTSVPAGVFARSGLTSIKLPETVTKIGAQAFAKCWGLTDVRLPANLTQIGELAFENCIRLEKINLPEGLVQIDGFAFTESGLTEINMPSTVKKIGQSAFYGCTKLQSVRLPQGLEFLVDRAFRGCKALTELSIPNSVTYIGKEFIAACENLQKVEISAGNEKFYSEGGCVIERASGTLIAGCNTSVIPCDGSVKSICDMAFFFCKNLKSITIPESVVSIGEYAFKGCCNLTINCAAIQKPSGWKDSWNADNRPVVWGCKVPEERAQTPQKSDEKPTQDEKPAQSEQENSSPPAQKPTQPEKSDEPKINADAPVRDGDFVTFGMWPQSKKAANVTLGKSADENGYYTGSDGSKYIYEKYEYYKVEPLKWKILEERDGRALVLCEDIIINISFGYKGITYADSQLRTWLNIDFYNRAFSSGAKSYIQTTLVDNSSQSTGHGEKNRYACSDTSDNVFLLSFEEAFKKYNFDRRKKRTAFARANILLSVDGIWWLRSPSVKLGEMWTVDMTGRGNREDTSKHDAMYGIVPAMWIELAKDEKPTQLKKPETTANGVNAAAVNSSADFEIVGGVLQKYKGKAAAVTIPEGVTQIGAKAFSYNLYVKSIIVPYGVTAIGENAFESCKITAISLPESLTSVGQMAFRFCTELLSIDLPENITRIEKQTFYACKSLKNITIPPKVKYIGDMAFYKCLKFTNIVIPDSVTNIDMWAFQGCKNLKTILIPKTVTTLGKYAFEGCKALTIYCRTVSQPAGWHRIWNYGNRPVIWGYMEVTPKPPEKNTPQDDPSAGAGETDSEENSWADDNGYGDFEMAGGEIAGGVLERYSGDAAAVKIPEDVTEIGEEAFGYLLSLSAVEIPTNVKTIGRWAFRGCRNLEKVNLPNGVTVKSGAFDNCKNLRQITIPKDAVFDGELSFAECENLGAIEIPATVTSIAAGGFEGCLALRTVVIPSSVKKISDRAFAGCKNLESIIIPAGVDMGRDVFAGDTKLKIFSRDQAKPNVWDKDWNVVDSGVFGKKRAKTEWGYRG